MSQGAIELILARQLAGYVSVPIIVVDPRGNLFFYNEAAEALLGLRFDETGEMSYREWSRLFALIAGDGTPLQPDARPLAIALQKRRPNHGRFRFRGADGVWRRLGITAFPLEGPGGPLLGAVAIFWEVPAPRESPVPSGPVMLDRDRA